MDGHHHGPGVPRPGSHPGITPARVVRLWVVAGWPASWILLLFVSAQLGIAFGIAITIAMVVTVIVTGSAPPPGVAAARSRVDARYAAVRRDVEGIAAVTAIGGCGWCGSLSAHVDGDGRPVPPRYWHAAEIEERIREKLGR